jgi:membrane protease YdiL (CAAX protease family)
MHAWSKSNISINTEIIMTTTTNINETPQASVNWKQVALFLGLTIGLSWLVDLWLWLQFGYGQYAILFLQFQMLIPAAVAIALQRYVFKDSPLYYRTYNQRPTWFFNFYLLFSAVFLALLVLTGLNPALYPAPLSGVVMLLLVLSLVALVVIRRFSGKQGFQEAGLSGGNWRAWLLVWLAVVGYNALQTGLNVAFGLGASPDLSGLAASAGMPVSIFLIASLAQTVVMGPFLGLVIGFGEEYGWRGYLQSQLIKLGKVRGVLLVGLIWGVWHAPAVAMGHNYPGYPLLGPIAFLVFNLALAVILGYVMLKTGSVWLVAFMHAILNQSYSWLIALVYTPSDPLLSFGAGVYGILCAFGVAALLLRDRVWRQSA